MNKLKHKTPPFRARTTALACVLLVAAAPGSAATFNWASGNFVPGTTAPATLAAGDVLDIVAGSGKAFDAIGFINNGTVNWAAGVVTSPNSIGLVRNATVVNNGLWVATSSGTSGGGNLPPALSSDGGTSTSAFTNTGTFRKTGEGRVTIRVQNFVNSGPLEATAGVLNIDSLTTAGATFNAGTSFTGAGVIQVGTTSGFAATQESYRFNGAFTSTNLSLDSVSAGNAANFQGDGAVLNGNMAWRGGRMSGTWNIASGSTMNVTAGGGPRSLIASLSIDGTLAVNASFTGGGGGVVTNRGSVLLNGFSAQPGSSFINNGLVLQAAGFANAVLLGPIVNNGRIENNGGLLTLQPTVATFNAGTVFAGTGATSLYGVPGTTATFNGAFSATNLTFDGQGSTVAGNDAVQSGLVKFTPAGANTLTMTGTWRVAADGELALTGGVATGIRRLSGASTVLTIDGKMTVDAPTNLSIESNARIVNNGTVEVKVDQGFLGGLGGSGTGNGGTFTNHGTLVKTGGTGTSTLGGATALTVINNGSIDVQTGTLRLRDNFSNAGTLKGNGSFQVVGTLTNAGTLAPGSFGTGTLTLSTTTLVQTAAARLSIDLTSLSAFDLLNVSGAATLGGTLALNCLGACSFAVGDSITILDATALNGSFASITLNGFGSGAFDVLYDAPTASVRLLVTQAVTAVPEPESWALLLAGGAGLFWRLRRVRRQRQHSQGDSRQAGHTGRYAHCLRDTA